MNKFKALLQKINSETQHKRVYFGVVFGLVIISFVLVYFSNGRTTLEEPKKTEAVLGAESTPPPLKKPTPTPTSTPTPTKIIRRVLSTISPTTLPTPTPTQSTNTSSNTSSTTPTATPTPTQVSATSTPTPTTLPTPTPTPTPIGVNVEVKIDYAGQKANDSYITSVDTGQNAWEAVKKAIGIENLQYTDYGEDLGIFITGFNGTLTTNSQFYEFRVNGVPSQVGVSTYICRNDDKLEFVLTNF